MGDERFYLIATEEVDNDQQDAALWAKARTRARGDETQSRYFYIELRVAQLQAGADRGSQKATEVIDQTAVIGKGDITRTPQPERKEQIDQEQVKANPESASDPTADPDEWIARPYKGIGPWLWVLSILLVLNALGNIGLYSEQAAQLAALSGSGPYTAFKAIPYVMLAVAFAIFFELKNGTSWSSVRTAIGLLWVYFPGMVICEYIILGPLFYNIWSLEEIFQSSNLRELSVALTAGCIWAGAWTLYLVKSERIALTFDKAGHLARKKDQT